METSIEDLFIRALGNSTSESPIVGDLTSFSKVDSRNRNLDYVKAGEEYCDKSFSLKNFKDEINKIIKEIRISGPPNDFSHLTNFTLVPGIYEVGMGDNNFPKIRQDVLESLNSAFFPNSQFIGKKLGINLLNNSFIKNKKGTVNASEIELKGEFYKERLKYFTRTGKPDLKERVESFKTGIYDILVSIKPEEKKNYFLVSHSKFMLALCKSICDTNQVPYFDNLDVLHLIVRKDEIRVKGIYRWNTSYNLEIQSFFGNCKKKLTKDLQEPYLNLFMMRHCVACHNVVDDFTKLKKKVFRSSNFGSTSMCLRLVEDLNDANPKDGNRKIMGLIKMLRENTGNQNLIESINFGSSVSLRTTLTGLVVQRMIALNTTPPTALGDRAPPPEPDTGLKRSDPAEQNPIYAFPNNPNNTAKAEGLYNK